MQISSRFTIALHIFACIEAFNGKEKLTSDFLSRSINTNPVIVRRILLQLRDAGLLSVRRGTGGISISKPLDAISFYDVYKAVEAVDDNEGLFHFHENPSQECPVGRNIHALLDDKLAAIQEAMEAEMRHHSLAELSADVRRIVQQ